jgi:carbonic anhydrase
VISGPKALEKLKEGNRRFVQNATEARAGATATRREQDVETQRPFAILLGCSDSRVPTEPIFDQDFGQLFVTRVAGNVITPTQAGSIELGVERLGVKLIVILGHSHCGAIQMALDELEGKTVVTSPNLRSILDCIQPSLKALLSAKPEQDRVTLLAEAAKTNVRASVARLQQVSPLLQQQIETNDLLVVGAIYSLQSGIVDFFDGSPLAV